MKNQVIGACCIAMVLSSFALSAQGDLQAPPYDLSVTLTGTTDYVFLGTSNTSEKPALQLGIDWAHQNGLFAKVWGSEVDFGITGEGTWEVDYSLGYSGDLKAFDYLVAISYFTFPGSDHDLGLDFGAVTVNAGHSLGPAYLSTRLDYSPDFFLNTGDTFNLKGGVSVPIPLEAPPFNVAIDASVARLWVEDNNRFTLPDYYYWSFGSTAKFKNVSADLRYFNTDLSRCDSCDERLVFSVSMAY